MDAIYTKWWMCVCIFYFFISVQISSDPFSDTYLCNCHCELQLDFICRQAASQLYANLNRFFIVQVNFNSFLTWVFYLYMTIVSCLFQPIDSLLKFLAFITLKHFIVETWKLRTKTVAYWLKYGTGIERLETTSWVLYLSVSQK